MDRQVSISVGIVVASSRPAAHEKRSWRARAALVGENGIDAGRLLKRDDEADYYFAGAADLRLSADEIDAYRANLENEPRLYCLLAKRDDADAPPLVHLVTADPAEAEDYLAAAPDMVEEIAMPVPLADLISIFIDSHAEDEDELAPTRAGDTVH